MDMNAIAGRKRIRTIQYPDLYNTNLLCQGRKSGIMIDKSKLTPGNFSFEAFRAAAYFPEGIPDPRSTLHSTCTNSEDSEDSWSYNLSSDDDEKVMAEEKVTTKINTNEEQKVDASKENWLVYDTDDDELPDKKLGDTQTCREAKQHKQIPAFDTPKKTEASPEKWWKKGIKQKRDSTGYKKSFSGNSL